MDSEYTKKIRQTAHTVINNNYITTQTEEGPFSEDLILHTEPAYNSTLNSKN